MTPNQKSLYELLKSYYEHKTGKLIPVNVEGDELKEAVSKAEEESRRIKNLSGEVLNSQIINDNDFMERYKTIVAPNGNQTMTDDQIKYVFNKFLCAKSYRFVPCVAARTSTSSGGRKKRRSRRKTRRGGKRRIYRHLAVKAFLKKTKRRRKRKKSKKKKKRKQRTKKRR